MTTNVADLYPDTGTTLKARDNLGMNRTVRITEVDVISYPTPEGKDEQKLVVAIQGSDKGIVLNKTNARSLVAMYGDDWSKWKGSEFQLSTIPHSMNGETVYGWLIQPPSDPDDDIPFG